MIRRPSNTLRRGFSLLELSVVLGIIALIAGAGVSMAQGALKAADRITTQERLNTIKLALDSYSKTYGFLPCPFDRSLSTSSTSFGVERRSASPITDCGTTNGTSFINAFPITTGGVPVRTLGLPDNYAADAWGNKLTYVVTNNHVSAPSSYSVMSSGITMKTGTLTSSYNLNLIRNSTTGGTASSNAGKLRLTFAAVGSLTTSMTAYISGTSYGGSYNPSAVTATTVDFSGVTFTNADTGVSLTWQEAGTNTSYVVFSHGPDGVGAYPLNASAVPAAKACGVTTIDSENCDNDATFFDTTYNDGTQASLFYDDYIVWGSNDLYRSPVKAGLYFNGLTGCPTGTCELWCATCATNYPGADANVPPTAAGANAILFKKILTTDSVQCSASCFWSGVTASGYQKIP